MKNFAEVLGRAAQIGPLPLVLAAAQDEEALRALKAACEAGLAQPMLVGDEALIRPLLARVGLPSSIPIVDEPDPAQAAVAAAKAVNGTQSGILMKGLVNSGDFLRAVFPLRRRRLATADHARCAGKLAQWRADACHDEESAEQGSEQGAAPPRKPVEAVRVLDALGRQHDPVLVVRIVRLKAETHPKTIE